MTSHEIAHYEVMSRPPEILRFAQDDRAFVGSKRGRVGDLLSKSPTIPLS
jgi:hypothetical protein